MQLAIETSCDFYDDYYEDDCEVRLENNDILIAAIELKPLVQTVIKNYFIDKKLHNRSKIEDHLLELPYYTNLLIKTGFSDAIQHAYELMADNGFMQGESSGDNLSEDVKYMLDLMKKIQKWVPKEFVGGMILMHLELIEGIEICQVC
jgi:hypothetical protein